MREADPSSSAVVDCAVLSKRNGARTPSCPCVSRDTAQCTPQYLCLETVMIHVQYCTRPGWVSARTGRNEGKRSMLRIGLPVLAGLEGKAQQGKVLDARDGGSGWTGALEG